MLQEGPLDLVWDPPARGDEGLLEGGCKATDLQPEEHERTVFLWIANGQHRCWRGRKAVRPRRTATSQALLSVRVIMVSVMILDPGSAGQPHSPARVGQGRPPAAGLSCAPSH